MRRTAWLWIAFITCCSPDQPTSLLEPQVYEMGPIPAGFDWPLELRWTQHSGLDLQDVELESSCGRVLLSDQVISRWESGQTILLRGSIKVPEPTIRFRQWVGIKSVQGRPAGELLGVEMELLRCSLQGQGENVVSVDPPAVIMRAYVGQVAEPQVVRWLPVGEHELGDLLVDPGSVPAWLDVSKRANQLVLRAATLKREDLLRTNIVLRWSLLPKASIAVQVIYQCSPSLRADPRSVVIRDFEPVRVSISALAGSKETSVEEIVEAPGVQAYLASDPTDESSVCVLVQAVKEQLEEVSSLVSIKVQTAEHGSIRLPVLLSREPFGRKES